MVTSVAERVHASAHLAPFRVERCERCCECPKQGREDGEEGGGRESRERHQELRKRGAHEAWEARWHCLTAAASNLQ